MRSILLALAGLVALTTVAEAKQIRYVGIHPAAKSDGGGMCYIEAPHVHVYPADKLQYRDHEGHNHFVGDPVAYGYDGPRYAYKGHHPIHVHAVVGDDHEDVEYCYLDGPHYHPFQPAVEADFKLAGDAYFYVGTPAPVYVEARPAYVSINTVYRPLVYARPVVTVEAPVGWIGANVVVAGPDVVVAAPRAHVVGPAVGVHADVYVPMPSLSVDIGFGGGVVVDDHHHHRGYERHKFKGGKRGVRRGRRW
ncbi:MAG: hypothetical protein WKG01_12335 [Kofleriaceae bacterium]